MKKLIYSILIIALVTAGLLETGLRVFLGRQDPNSVIYFCNDDAWWKLRWFVKSPRVPNRVIWLMQQDPVLGWIPKPNLFNKPVYSGKNLSTNAQSARSDRDFLVEKDPKKIRVALLGDSYSFGFGVGQSETYAQVLQQHYPQLEIMNFSVEGYGHDQMLLTLQRRVAPFHPDIVILGYNYYDNERNDLNFREFAKPRFDLVDGALKRVSPAVPSPEQVVLQQNITPKIYQAAQVAACHLRTLMEATHKEKTDRLTNAVLREIATVSRQMGAYPVFVHLPVGEEINNRILKRIESEVFLQSVCEAEKADCVFMRDKFRQALNEGRPGFVADLHWKEREHHTAGQALIDYFDTLLKKFPPTPAQSSA